jgi:hypothetical protein
MNTLAEIATGSVIIGIALIALVAAVTIVAIIRYDVDAVLKIWGALGTLLGLVVGTMGTYFFTKDQVEQKDSQIRVTQAALQATQREKDDLGGKLQGLSQQIASFESNKSEIQAQSKEQPTSTQRMNWSARAQATPTSRKKPFVKPF